jgi:hypothetical protein
MPNRAIAFTHAERQELAVQIRQILGPGHRRAGPAFQREYRTLHVAFFLPSGRHAEQRVEPVVRRQRRVGRVQSAVPPTQNLNRQCLGIIPPDFTRHTAKELERTAHPLQDRFRTLAGQRDQERAIAVCPHATEHVRRSPAIGIIHLHLAKVELHPSARRMVQTHECLATGLTQRGDIAPDRVITTGVAVLGLQPLVNALGMVTLLARG